jgi:disulfide bond formation protein DsbB
VVASKSSDRFVPSDGAGWPGPRTVCLWLALLALASLAFAFLLEYAFGMHPCALCIKERYAFGALAVAGLGGFLLDQGRLGLLLCLAILLGTTGLTVYHVGVEFGWFEMSATCTGAGRANSLEDLRKMLQVAGPTCDRPAWLVPNVLSVAQATAAWAALLTVLTASTVVRTFVRR